VSAPKPGNVTPGHDFSDTTYADMVRSALVLGPVFTRARARRRGVGELIADGVAATEAIAGANTNLGIVLLFAPLVHAEATRQAGETLRSATERTLARLGVDDAAAAFAAIAAAADRDSIASEYATGFTIVFDTGLPLLTRALEEGLPTLQAIVSLHVGLLAGHPDTLIARKVGVEAARAVSAAAREVRDGRRSLRDLDASLRGDDNRLNPGTTADLVAATLLAALLSQVRLP
jgi:triphosphoribosyl-dephospho-CoA synthase